MSPSLAQTALKCCEPGLPKELLDKNWLLIVTSQDCDVVHPNLSAEPWVELIAITAAGKEDGNFLHLRNPRRLQFYLNVTGEPRLMEATIHDRCRIPRELLAEGPPSNEASLQPDQLSCLVRWLARRYERSAMPDEFNKRLRPCQRKIKKLLERACTVIQQVLIALDPWEELPEGANYNAVVLGTIRRNDYHDTSKIRTAEQALVELEELVSAVDGIDIRVEVRSEADVSIHDLRSFHPWDFESLSFGESESGPMDAMSIPRHT